MALALYK
jgi:hypothetical protein